MRLRPLSFLLSFLVTLLCFTPSKIFSSLEQRILRFQASSHPSSRRAEERTKPFDVPWQGKKFQECVIPKWNRRGSYDEAKCPVVGIADHI